MHASHTHTDRYLKIVHWARARYACADGSLVISVGGMPSIYSQIEDLAFRRYIQ